MLGLEHRLTARSAQASNTGHTTARATSTSLSRPEGCPTPPLSSVAAKPCASRDSSCRLSLVSLSTPSGSSMVNPSSCCAFGRHTSDCDAKKLWRRVEQRQAGRVSHMSVWVNLIWGYSTASSRWAMCTFVAALAYACRMSCSWCVFMVGARCCTRGTRSWVSTIEVCEHGGRFTAVMAAVLVWAVPRRDR